MFTFRHFILLALALGLLFFTGCKKDGVSTDTRFPFVVTTPVEAVNLTSVQLGGKVHRLGQGEFIERGICWDTLPAPNLSNNFKSTSGDLGEFSILIDSLSNGGTYYMRAYARNTEGAAYGEVIKVTPGLFTEGQGVTDIDGNNYGSVVIGNQEWMVENLKSTAFCNGDPIPFLDNMTDWVEAGSMDSSFSAYTFINFNENQGAIFGNIYNHSVPRDARNICPCGWRIPSWYDWVELFEFVDPNTTYSLPGYTTSTSASQKLRSVEYWSNQFGSTAGTNEAGLKILPGGILSSGSSGTATISKLWSTSQHPTDSLMMLAPQFSGYSENIVFSINWYTSGAYIRCIRN